MTIKFKKLFEEAKIPTRGSAEAAGLDLYAESFLFEQNRKPDTRHEGGIILPGSRVIVATGIACELAPGTMGMVVSRSGLARKQWLRVYHAPGIVDSDFRGELVVLLENTGMVRQILSRGDRVAQMVVVPCVFAFEEVKELLPSSRGVAGWGSTGQ